jgi:hypothetical protein
VAKLHGRPAGCRRRKLLAAAEQQQKEADAARCLHIRTQQTKQDSTEGSGSVIKQHVLVKHALHQGAITLRSIPAACPKNKQCCMLL